MTDDCTREPPLHNPAPPEDAPPARLLQRVIEADRSEQSFGFYLAPKFSMISLTCTIEPLRIANEILGLPLFRWSLISRDGQRVTSINELDISVHHSLESAPKFDAIAVCASYDLQNAGDPVLYGWLRRQARFGAQIGAIDTGSYIIAKAGLLSRRRCTIHWQNLDAFRDEFPDVEVTSNLFEIDGDRFSCGGATAGLDMMLHMIAVRHSPQLARHTAEQLIFARLKSDHSNQRSSVAERLNIRDPKLGAALAIMETEIEQPLPIDKIAIRSGLTARHLERLFHQQFGKSPKRFYADLRLSRARTLLHQSNTPLIEIALRSGFPSYAHFSRSYKKTFGLSPLSERRREDEAGRT